MHMRRSFPVLLAAASIVVAAGCGGEEEMKGTTVSAPPESREPVGECQKVGGERRKRFHVDDEGFEPRRVVVRSGRPITFVNCGDKPHSVTLGSGPGKKYDSGTLQPKERFAITFVARGTHRIIDRHNPDAKMVIEVTGLPNQPQN